jgi:hypothetical protein
VELDQRQTDIFGLSSHFLKVKALPSGFECGLAFSPIEICQKFMNMSILQVPEQLTITAFWGDFTLSDVNVFVCYSFHSSIPCSMLHLHVTTVLHSNKHMSPARDCCNQS